MSFGNDAEALGALESGVVVVDHKHWGRLRVAGEDRLTFLHGQSTADFLAMQPGRGCLTVRSQNAAPALAAHCLPVQSSQEVAGKAVRDGSDC